MHKYVSNRNEIQVSVLAIFFSLARSGLKNIQFGGIDYGNSFQHNGVTLFPD